MSIFCQNKIQVSFHLLWAFCVSFLVSGQEKEAINYLRKYQLEEVENLLLATKKSDGKALLWQLKMLKIFDFYGDDIQNPYQLAKTSNVVQGIYQSFYGSINMGDYLFYKFNDKNLQALEEYRNALVLAKTQKDSILICEALKKILTVHRIHYLYDNITFEQYLEDYKNYAYDDYEKAFYNYFNLILNFKNYKVDQWNSASYEWLSKYFENNNVPYLKGITYTVFASYYEELGEFERVWYYIREAENEFSKIEFAYAKSRYNQLLVFAARIAAKESKRELLDSYLAKFDNAHSNKTDLQLSSLFYFYDSVKDTLYGNFKMAYRKYKQYELIQDSLRKFRYDDLLNDLETKYQTAEKEKQILEEQQKVRANRNWLIAAGITLILGFGIAILLQKNTTKKRLLAEQESQLKQHRLENLLKEQELVSIDAMIEGQEKERQKVANELHDDLGSLMATIKLHFDNAKVSEKDPAIQNAQKLLEEAYQKIRGMAHSKNSGVMSDQGLLPAIKKMARTISETNALNVTVEDFGLGERLENSLELTIFRMVQELVANAIKHANATKVGIHLTQHEDQLNIIVEDNGSGFDSTKVSKVHNGMGLTTIEKRVEHLEGNFTIDSVLGKGTSILIDIPV